MKAWHFVGDTLRDGRPVPADGVELVHEGAVEMCRSGLHASTRLLDALSYAPRRGSTACRVECRNVVARDRDKFVCRSRTILYRVDANDILRIFARRCALDVAYLWDAPDVALRYLRTGDESLQAAARDAALDATRDAVRDAARDAARAAVRDAALDAARSAARDAARAAVLAAALDVARSAAWAAAREKQNRRLVQMVVAERRKA